MSAKIYPFKCVVYARVSTEEQGKSDKASIPEQVDWAKKLCGENDWQYIREYVDIGEKRDSELEDREGSKQLLEDAKDIDDSARTFDLVLAWDSTRIAGESDILGGLARVLGYKKIQIYTPDIGIDPVPPNEYDRSSNASQEYVTAFTGISNKQENVKRGERVRMGHRGLAKKGKAIRLPYGYKKIKEFDEEGDYTWHFEIESKEAVIVEKMFNWYGNEGYSYRSIRQELNYELEIPSPAGKDWTTPTIKSLLSNPAFIGKVRWGKRLGSRYRQGRTESGRVKRETADEEDIILEDGQHPVIISEGLFNKVQRRMKKRRKIAKKKGGGIYNSKHILTGLVICGQCGRPAYYQVNKYKNELADGTVKEYKRGNFLCQTWFNYGKNECRRHVIAGKKIKKIVLKEIKNLVDKADKAKDLYRQERGKNEEVLKKRIASLEKSLSNSESESKRLLKAYKEEVIDLQEFSEAKGDHEYQVKEMREQLGDLRDALNDKKTAEERSKEFYVKIRSFDREFKEANFNQKRDLVHDLIEEIVITENRKVKIKFAVGSEF